MRRNNSKAEQTEQAVQTAPTQTAEQKKSNLEQCMVLWSHLDSKVPYVTGRVGTREDGFDVVGFFNGKKKNPKEPDLRIYEQYEKGYNKEELVSLWLNQTKDGLQYYTGYDNEHKRLVAFHNANKRNKKAPDISVYYSVDKQSA